MAALDVLAAGLDIHVRVCPWRQCMGTGGAFRLPDIRRRQAQMLAPMYLHEYMGPGLVNIFVQTCNVYGKFGQPFCASAPLSTACWRQIAGRQMSMYQQRALCVRFPDGVLSWRVLTDSASQHKTGRLCVSTGAVVLEMYQDVSFGIESCTYGRGSKSRALST